MVIFKRLRKPNQKGFDMIYDVKIFDKEGNLKEIVRGEDMQAEIWERELAAFDNFTRSYKYRYIPILEEMEDADFI